jgi:oligopeptide transport system substrate-binding protein
MKLLVLCGVAGVASTLALTALGSAPAARTSLRAVVARAAGEPSGPPQHGGTFTMGLPSDVPTMDPAQAGYDFESWSMTVAIYSALVDYDKGLHLRGDLAQTWTISNGGKTYTFHLRPNLEFSDGSPLTASDAKFSIERILNPKTGSPGSYLFSGIVGAPAYSAGKAKSVSGIQTPDARTLVIRLSAPETYFLNVLAMPYARVMDPAQVAKYGKGISRHPLGSGPFMLKRWTPGQEIVLVRNPHFYQPGHPYLDEVDVGLNVNDQTRVLKFSRGELSISDIPSAAFAQLALNPKWKPYIVTNHDASTYYVGMKNLSKPFTSKLVRQALNYAVNKQRLVQLLNGRGIVSHGVIPPPLPGYDPNGKPYPFNPSKAKQLLKQAGYPEGFSTEIWTINDEQSLRIVQSIANDLAAVGVKAKVRAMDSSSFYANVSKKDRAPMFFTFWLADYPDAYDFFSSLLIKSSWGPTNSAYFYDPRVDRNVAAIAHSTDQARRVRIMRQTDRIVLGDAPWVFLYHTVTLNVHQPNVYYYIHPVHLWRFADYWIKH